MFDCGQQEKVPRIKSIKKPLQSLPFLPVIHGKRDKAESCRAIVSHCSREREKGYTHTGSDQRVLLAEDIKQKHSNVRKVRVIRTQQQ